VVALVVAAAIGQPLSGVALALGLILGGGNGFLAVRLLGSGSPSRPPASFGC